MARVLYLHGSNAGPFGDKTEYLKRHGHHVVGHPRLPYPRHPRRSWRWLAAYLDKGWFRHAVEAAQEAFDDCRPDVVVGSSMGGAVAMNLASDTPQVLVAPAWRAWWLLRFGEGRSVGPATVIVHGERDRTVFPRYSRILLANSRHHDEDLIASTGRRLAERLGGQDLFQVERRLVLVRGEGHRCNGGAALAALLAGVEVLAGPGGPS